MKFRVGRKTGDTLIEVMFAIGIFSMVAITIVSLMSSGSSNMRTSLETTMARNEIDAQAEALRFIHQSYIAEMEDDTAEDDRVYTELWNTIKSYAFNRDSAMDTGGDDNSLWYMDNEALLKFQPQTCEELYDDTRADGLKKQRGFVINTQQIGNKYANRIISSTNSRSSFRQAELYPRVFYAGDNGMLGRSSTFNAAEGLYIIAVRDPGSTTITKDQSTTSTDTAYYDFYIRSCWTGYGKTTPTTISTLIRLYDPDVAVENNDNMDYVLTYDLNGGSCLSGDTDCPSQDIQKGKGGSKVFKVADYSSLSKGGIAPFGWSEGGTCNDSGIYKPNTDNNLFTIYYTSPFKTLKAIWDCQYRVVYNKGNLTGAEQVFLTWFPETQNLTESYGGYQPTLAAAPTFNGGVVSFKKWKCGGVEYDAGSLGPELSPTKREITCEAIWDRLPTYNYSLKYEANATGVSNMPNPSQVKANNKLTTDYSFTVSDRTPTRSGFDFLGWADTSSATTAQYHSGDTITLYSSNPSKSIYAVWRTVTPPQPSLGCPYGGTLHGDICIKNATPSAGYYYCANQVTAYSDKDMGHVCTNADYSGQSGSSSTWNNPSFDLWYTETYYYKNTGICSELTINGKSVTQWTKYQTRVECTNKQYVSGSYSCPYGWSEYGGSGSLLKCYRAATPI